MNDLNASAMAIAVLLADRAGSIPVPTASLAATRRRARQRSTHLRTSTGVAGLALLGGAIGLTQLRSGHTTKIATPGGVDGSLTVPPSSGPQVVIPTDPAIEKTRLAEELKINSTGLAVLALQNRLKELAFDPGPADGYFGFATHQAVWAFEKLVLRRPPGDVTGVLTDEMWQIMQDPIEIAPRRLKSQTFGERPTHVEIYLPEQVLILFTDDKPALITHISSGSDKAWCDVITYQINDYAEELPEPRTADMCGDSETPGGLFAFYARYEGNRLGTLGEMWNPVFFNYGIAVYGSNNVPLEPDSHGGVRIPMFIADYFPSLVENKDRVYVFDDVREPEEYSREDKQPASYYPNPNATTSSSTAP